MKLLHINSYYYESVFYKGLYEKQFETGLDLSVYVPVPKPRPESSFAYGDYTQISENHGKYDRVLFHVKHRKIYEDIIRKYDVGSFDLIHAHSLFSNGCIALKLKEKYQIPYVVAVRSTDVRIFFKKMIHLRKLGVKILEQAQAIILLSETYRDILVEGYIPIRLRQQISDKVRIIPNGIDNFWFENLGKFKSKPKPGELKLVFAGQISKRKNPAATIEAIKILEKRGYPVRFAIAGSIGDQKLYRDIIKHPFVTYLGIKSKEELIDIYRENDIFIMPSRMETFGLTYAEALSQGLPILYTKGEGFDRQFEDGVVGYPVDCCDPSDIADKLVKVLDTYEDLSRNCIVLCDKFNWNQIADEYETIYENQLAVE